MASDVKYIHSRKYIYQIEKCIYVVSQNGKSHSVEMTIYFIFYWNVIDYYMKGNEDAKKILQL